MPRTPAPHHAMLAAALIVAVARSPAATGASGRYANPQLLAETEELAR